jgi:hypothetical protein
MPGVSDQINRVKFVSEDFETYRQEADQFFQTNYPEDFNDLAATNLGNALLDQIAFAMQALTFTINRRASELFLATARLTSSITKLARMLGYPISPAQPPSSTANIVFPGAPYPFPIPIPVGFQFQGPGSTIYEYRETLDFVIPANQTSAAVPIKEGTSRQLAFISDGTPNQQFQLTGITTGQFLYSDQLIVTVDGVAWTRQGLLKFESENIYEVQFSADPPLLIFGDGIAGNLPPQGSEIVIEFAFGQGNGGAIGSNQISGPVNQLVINGQVIDMNITNPTSDAGQPPEDIRHVRAFASSFFRTQNAAVVKSDYDSIAALQPGVALADAQILRGVSMDITIEGFFAELQQGTVYINQAVQNMLSATVSGISFLGVSGIDQLAVDGIPGLGVSGQDGLGVSGTDFLGWNGSEVTGTQFLGVSGIVGLFVSGEAGLSVGGIPSLGVSGEDSLGISNFGDITDNSTSGTMLILDGVSGLESYLSQVFSDTSKSNNVQVIVLSVDANNKYIPPSPTTLSDVQVTLQALADAVVTVQAVDGSSKIVPVDLLVELGISQTAVSNDVVARTTAALIQTTTPLGLLVKRPAGQFLYTSDVKTAVENANQAGDLRFINVRILSPSNLLDADGNLIITSQQIIQNNNVSVKVVKRVTDNE